MKGEHKPGYRPPRTGEKRKTRQPFKIEKFPQKVRDEILKARAEGATWEEVAERASKAAGENVSASMCHRWNDVFIEQVRDAAMERAEAAQSIAAAFAGKDFPALEESVKSALASEVFELMRVADPNNRGKFAQLLADFGWLLSDMKRSDVAQQKLELDRKQFDLEKEKFEQAKQKADKLTNDVAKKLGEGKPITAADIDRIRERAFGLPPVQRSASSGNPA